MTATTPTVDPTRRAALEAAAERLIAAAATATPCPPVRELLPDATLDDGYAVQRLVHERTAAGRRRVGRKIGLTSEAVQRQMGVDTPDLGVLHADMAYADGETIPYDRLLQPRIEAEVAFVLGADLPPATGHRRRGRPPPSTMSSPPSRCAPAASPTGTSPSSTRWPTTPRRGCS